MFTVEKFKTISWSYMYSGAFAIEIVIFFQASWRWRQHRLEAWPRWLRRRPPNRRGQLKVRATNSILSCFTFVKKNQWFAWKLDQWRLAGKRLLSSVLPSNSFASISDPWRAYWAHEASFKGPQPHLQCCLQNYYRENQWRRQVCCNRPGDP